MAAVLATLDVGHAAYSVTVTERERSRRAPYLLEHDTKSSASCKFWIAELSLEYRGSELCHFFPINSSQKTILAASRRLSIFPMKGAWRIHAGEVSVDSRRLDFNHCIAKFG
jgi:hypothetical protein